MADEKPYRPNVGIALFNASGLVLIGGVFGTTDRKSFFQGLSGRCRRAVSTLTRIHAMR